MTQGFEVLFPSLIELARKLDTGFPAATAFAFMQTKDQKCLTYLTNLVAKFQGGVPHLYPIDMFEQIWMVDRLQRLGIARYFRSEIKECVDYIYRYWDEQGMGFTRNCNLPDIDETAMAFRLLRTNGYQVSSDAFRHFEKDGQFVCYHGQSSEAVTVMFNLYRACQVLFPGDKILDDAKKFSYNFLIEKGSKNELLDKWIIAKDLPGEVGYALDVPWYACLPRLEARYYLEQYGGDEDIWIGKYLYRRELKHETLWLYYEAAASIFEPERCNERVAWAVLDDPAIGFGIESKMQELVQLVLCDSPNDLDTNSKQKFLTVAKTFYYRALFDPEAINQHISKVLFENAI
ncbi:hypothetical protein L1987_82606 [Smallanthus sonchifolius]|uniref:Uncharacterized protein n=1 Tax=Smallanthus sonchifolius TaxID=185202 RepID=A0ACB8YEZ8_9ASTR|nr:hypothetical protein L1987_82606 [Smallanthus sonchifolius]